MRLTVPGSLFLMVQGRATARIPTGLDPLAGTEEPSRPARSSRFNGLGAQTALQTSSILGMWDEPHNHAAQDDPNRDAWQRSGPHDVADVGMQVDQRA
jgi:hypothetical protein